MTGLYTRTLNTFAAGACAALALAAAVDGRAWVTLIQAMFAGANGYIASRTTMRITPPVGASNGSKADHS